MNHTEGLPLLLFITRPVCYIMTRNRPTFTLCRVSYEHWLFTALWFIICFYHGQTLDFDCLGGLRWFQVTALMKHPHHLLTINIFCYLFFIYIDQQVVITFASSPLAPTTRALSMHHPIARSQFFKPEKVTTASGKLKSKLLNVS